MVETVGRRYLWWHLTVVPLSLPDTEIPQDAVQNGCVVIGARDRLEGMKSLSEVRRNKLSPLVIDKTGQPALKSLPAKSKSIDMALVQQERP